MAKTDNNNFQLKFRIKNLTFTRSSTAEREGSLQVMFSSCNWVERIIHPLLQIDKRATFVVVLKVSDVLRHAKKYCIKVTPSHMIYFH